MLFTIRLWMIFGSENREDTSYQSWYSYGNNR